MNVKAKIRCAIYTRKSHEDGLEQEYNSLDAQRDAGINYINSQRHEGWIALPMKYDDGGFSGGTMDRPAIKKLMEDIKDGLIDVVVVYKIDRLSRSIADFLKLIEFFEENSVTFVSVTQSFNTQNSMGKLMLNILLSFAQFEREVTGERIRDKIAASKKKGMWMGGSVPLGYDIVDRKLVINPDEAEIVKFIFEEYYRTCSLLKVTDAANKLGHRTKVRIKKDGTKSGGDKIARLSIYNILNNHIYIGKIHHKGEYYQGEHKPIISEELWNNVHKHIKVNSSERKKLPIKTKMTALLKGIIFDTQGYALTPSFSKKKDKIYKYYVNTKAIKDGYENCDIRLFPAEELENFIVGKIRQFVTTPDIINKVYQQAKRHQPDITVAYIRDALSKFDNVWEHLFPVERNRIVHLLVNKIIVGLNGVQINFHPNGILNLCTQLSRQEAA
jgi:site-specific DNA recombinase